VRDSLLLDQLGGLLAASQDGLDVLRQVARLLVPRAADLAVIDVLTDDGVPQRVTVECAANPALATVLHQSPADLRDGTYATTLMVLRSGTPCLRERCDPAEFELFLASARLTHGEQELLRTLQPRSYLAVPLISRGRCLGVISLLYTVLSGRRYAGTDQAWAQQLAGRLAATLEIARLERAAQEACARQAHLERELERERAVERAVVDAASGPIVVLDALGRLQRLNPVAERLLGSRPGELIGRPLWQLVPQDEAAAVRATLDAQATRRGLVSASPKWGTLLQMRDAEQASRPGLPALYPPESGWSAMPPDVTMGEQPSA
jgi:PAS domain-containing protein